MRTLIIDTSIDGHHLSYIKTLVEKNNNVIYLLPKKITELNKTIYLNSFNGKKKLDIIGYLNWIKEIKKIIKEEDINLVHFVYSDDIYRFCGIGLKSLNKRVEIIATQHHLRESKLRWICLKLFSKNLKYLVVHTKNIEKKMYENRISNVQHIEYPMTEVIPSKKKEVLCEYWNIPQAVPVLVALGGTRYDKGLDILLDALQQIENPFYLMIAGKEEDIKLKDIEEKIRKYKFKVGIHLRELTNEEFGWAVDVADCVILPYRYQFNGASGPLGEGVWRRKVIIGPRHGSLREIIENNRLGYTFQSESIDDLARVIKIFLENMNPSISNEYESYRSSLSPESFRKKYKKLYEAGRNKCKNESTTN